MPITYAIDVKRRYVFSTVTGGLTLNDVLNHKRDLAADPAFEPDMPEVSDARQLETVEFDESDLAIIAQQDMMLKQRLGENQHIAILVDRDDFFEMARGYEQLTLKAGLNVGVFRDLDAALEWLDIT